MRTLISVILTTELLACSVTASTQGTFEDFWPKFQRAVKSKDKNAVAALTKFPLSMPYGLTSVKNKAELGDRFGEIFDGEANAAKCFSQEKPTRESRSHYSIACGFKKEGAGGDKPIVYHFERTKEGWRFTGLDNVNE